MAQKVKQIPVTVSLNAYSFNGLLTAKSDKPFTYMELLEWCSKNNIKALDATGYYFPGYPAVPSDEYINRFKERAATLGVSISGTGVRNNFASPDPKIRAEGVELVKKWLVVAKKMGAPVLRVFSGEIPKGYEDKWEEVAGWMIECYKEVAIEAEKQGVKIGIQNHADMLQTAAQCKYVLHAVNSKWVRLVLDIGSFKTADPYKDIEEMLPYAINWQIKSSPYGAGGKETDMIKLFTIIRKGEYKGFLPIETLPVKGVVYDPFVEILKMKARADAAITKLYK